MSCNPAGDCWCKELPYGPMPVGNILEPQSHQAGPQPPSKVGTGATLPQATGATGCLCRDCLQQDLKAQGLLSQAPD
jgi:hypothetical protein